MAAVGVLVIAVTVTAAWIVNTALVTNPRVGAKTFTKPFAGPGALTLATSEPPVVKTADTSFDSKWARASTGGMPLLALQITDERARAAVAPAQVAKLIAAPAIPLPPKRVAEVVSVTPLPPAPPHVAQLAQLAQPEIFGPPIENSPQAKAPQIVPQVTQPASRRWRWSRRLATTAPHRRKRPPSRPNQCRTAVYDISARTVFLPSGERLEAHSGLYDKMDDPRYVNVRMRGPTPPNVYDLTLRQQLFHGVRAIRLNPVDEGKMFGRDGMLAHTYMLGPNGQSNGCVSFRDYDRFLQAFLRGEVDRLVVVPKGGTQLALAARSHRGKIGRYAANDAPPERYTGSW